ncbi:MAG: class I SAM-dependent methyltransferase [Candidatus Pacebacteria bacterium]|nr:class I SAM-dependent methyltransferase [Candidatus Paceibacterota bacterium]
MEQSGFSNDKFINPIAILDSLKLKDDFIACDLGCGSGGWAIPLSKILTNGLVYAVDILEESISALRGKIARENIFNVKPVLSDIEKGVKIQDKEIDIALLTNILFQIEDKESLIKECRRILKSRGLLLIIDWKKDAPLGPAAGRLSADEILPLLDRLGFREEKRFDAGEYHWALLLSK